MKLVRHPYVVRLHEVCEVLLSVDLVCLYLRKQGCLASVLKSITFFPSHDEYESSVK